MVVDKKTVNARQRIAPVPQEIAPAMANIVDVIVNNVRVPLRTIVVSHAIVRAILVAVP